MTPVSTQWWRTLLLKRHWSLAARIGLLNIGLCAALAISLTWLGTYRAVNELEEQAEAALAADARVVADGVDGWPAQRMAQLKSLANMRILRGYLESDENQRADTRGLVRDALTSHNSVASDVDSIALADPTGTFIASSNVGDIGQNVGQRDYFQEAMRSRPFISGVSISTITDAPSIFHSVPVRSESGGVVGVLRSRSKLDWVQQVVQSADGRVGVDATGVLLDESGLALKIDRAFISGLGTDDQSIAIVRSVIDLARNLTLAVTGEGIETVEQLSQLRELGCQQGQGNLFAQPISSDAVAALLASDELSRHGTLASREQAA